MSVVAWDGHTLAADRQGTRGCQPRATTKIFKRNGHLYGIVGTISVGMQMLEWHVAGADPEKAPKQDVEGDEYCDLVVIKPDGKAVAYEVGHVAMEIEEPFWAYGCGGPTAVGALAAGANSATAVKIACDHNIHCGLGIDTLTLGDN